jgi:predicted nucleic acid-binding protein
VVRTVTARLSLLIAKNDRWIAASTLETGACLVTFDAGFARVQGLDCIVLEA